MIIASLKVFCVSCVKERRKSFYKCVSQLKLAISLLNSLPTYRHFDKDINISENANQNLSTKKIICVGNN